jgi:hypothetical protein
MEYTPFSAIEFGGTKTICAVGTVDGELIAQATFRTEPVEQTLEYISIL